MKHYIKICIKTNRKTDALLKLNKVRVDIKNISYTKDGLTLEIKKDDLKKVKKYLSSFKIKIIDETGIYKIRKEFKKNSLFITSLVFGLFAFLVLSNVIISVNVIHNSKEIRELLTEALKERGVTSLTFKKSYEEYEHIIEEIKNEYKDKIEWLEIDVDGMIINVRVEERIVNNYETNYNTCHIVAAKSGTITSIRVEKGIAEVTHNAYVNAGDILINGMIKLNDEVKNNVCASGEVYAEVWYQVSSSLPLNYEEQELTGKWRFNFVIKTTSKEYTILKSRVQNKTIKKISLFKVFGIEFFITKEYETKITKKKYSEEEAIKKSTEIVHEKLAMNNQIEEIITEKVLKKSLNNDNLDMDIFIAVNEQIGLTEYYTIEMESDTNDESNNGGNN